jgi:hypothetical protein
VGVVLRTGVVVGGALAAMLLPSRDWTWPAAWFVVVAIVAFTLAPAAAFLSVHNPTLIAERERGIRWVSGVGEGVRPGVARAAGGSG